VNAPEETQADAVYKWTTRVLYTVAISLNVWYLLETYRETPEAKRIISKAEHVFAKSIRPWKERKRLRREETATVLEAWNIVDEAGFRS
jgi:hypothetical protein